MNLRLLSLQGNRIKIIEGLDSLVNLEELYLSENEITEIQGLDNLVLNGWMDEQTASRLI